MTCGIYKIGFSGTDKVYVGSSRDIEKRIKQHKAMLENDCHHSFKLQNYYNANKTEVHFSIVEECLEIDRFKVEAYWINKHNSIICGFNVAEVFSEDCVRYKGADQSFIGIPEVLEINFKDMLENNASISEEVVYSYIKYAISVCNSNSLEFCLSQYDIADVLKLSHATVKTHIKNLIDKNKIVVYKGHSHNRNVYQLPIASENT